MLEGKRVDLRALEKDDVDFVADCFNNLDFWGDNPFWEQVSKSEWMKHFENPPNAAVLVEWTRFIIQKKDGTKIGAARHRQTYDPEDDFIVLKDPDGNLFCVVDVSKR